MDRFKEIEQKIEDMGKNAERNWSAPPKNGTNRERTAHKSVIGMGEGALLRLESGEKGPEFAEAAKKELNRVYGSSVPRK